MNWLETIFNIIRDKWTWIRCKLHPASHIITQEITIQLLAAERDNFKKQYEQVKQLLDLKERIGKRELKQVSMVTFLLFKTEDIFIEALSKVSIIDGLKLSAFLKKKNELAQQFLNSDPENPKYKSLFNEASQLITEAKKNGFWRYRLPKE